MLTWALWDTGAAGLSAIVVTFVFSVYLTGAVGKGLPGGVTPASWLGRALGVAGLTIALLAPLIGVWVEDPHRRRMSLTVLTGWLGQLSRGQMAFAGLGALFAARLVEGGVPFWLAIAATTAGSAVLATVLGLSSLRVKGLYLAVVTFVFALAAQQYFFSLHILSGRVHTATKTKLQRDIRRSHRAG